MEMEQYGKHLEKVYQEVVAKFPDIEEDGIRITFNPSASLAHISMVDPDQYHLHGKKIVVNPIMKVGHLWFTLPNEQQKALIAHELGHYRRHKKHLHLPNRIKQDIDWKLELKTNKESHHSIKKLMGWYRMHEFYADEQALKVGYGKPLLQFMKDMVSGKLGIRISPMGISETNIRIKNLEEVLEND